MDSLDGTLARILKHAPGKFSASGMPFLVGKLAGSGTVVMGEIRRPIEGESYKFYGEWRTQKKYAEPAFFFDAFDVMIDRSENGIAKYLSDYIDGIGKIKAAVLVATFGVDTLDILRREPDRALSAPGIDEKLIASIRRHFERDCKFDPAAYANLIDMFSEYRIPKKIVLKLLETWGSSAPEALTANPYQLLVFRRLGWKTVDSLATAKLGYDPAGIHRHTAAIVEALEQISAEGHTFGSRAEVEAIAYGMIGGRPRTEAWAAAIDSLKVVRDTDIDDFADAGSGDEPWALAKLDHAERMIARRLADLSAMAKPLPVELSRDGLDGLQADAVGMIEEHGVCILSGSPGTGKSFTITKILSSLVKIRSVKIMVMAPTGKAARRAAELLAQHLPGNDIPCSTIHKALGPTSSEDDPGIAAKDARVNRGRDSFGFQHDESDPLEVDFAVIDECSMVDVRLMAAVLSAIPLGTRVVLVGDHNQLPSVGPGSVLRDLLAAGVPSTILTEVRRNCGRIVRACHAIKDGIVPEPSDHVDLEAGENWIHIELSKPADIAAEIIRRFEAVIANPNSRFDPLWDVQVVCAQIEKPAGICCRDLNRQLSPILNPPKATPSMGGGGNRNGDDYGANGDPMDDSSDDGPAPAFRINDKVVRKKNESVDEFVPVGSSDADGPPIHWRGRDYQIRETVIVNGDLGQILDIVQGIGGEGWGVIVKFLNPDRLCRLPLGDCHLIQAYAVTCHTAQGSGFPYVVIPVHNDYFWDNRKQIGIWCREWIYTAFSRAEQLLVTVGPMSAIRSAIGRKTIGRRRTRLVARIREPMGGEVKAIEHFEVIT